MTLERERERERERESDNILEMTLEREREKWGGGGGGGESECACMYTCQKFHEPLIHLGLDLSGRLEICREPSILGLHSGVLLAPDTARASISSWLSYQLRVM